MNFRAELNKLEEKGGLRRFRPLAGRESAFIEQDNTRLLNLTSNDYLGLAANRTIHEEFYRGTGQNYTNFLEEYGLGVASSRLLTGDLFSAHALEDELCSHYGSQSCLLFNSGYHANIGILPALATKHDLILSDKLNHASIHDGLRLSRASYKRYRHRDYTHLAELIESNRDKYAQIFIVTESVFSMDGDEADLQVLVELKKKYDCMLYVDEAHGVGLYGQKGLGKVEELGVIADVDLIVGTFGKAFGSIGAYVLCSADIKEFLINTSRSLIFTTALPPVIVHWNRFVFRHVLNMSAERRKLRALSGQLREALIHEGLETAGSTNIVPVMIGDNERTVKIAQHLQGLGYLIFAIRPPTVPVGTSRFRLSLTATMGWQDIEQLPRLIKRAMVKR